MIWRLTVPQMLLETNVHPEITDYVQFAGMSHLISSGIARGKWDRNACSSGSCKWN